MKITFLLLFVLITSALFYNAGIIFPGNDKIIGVKIYEYNGDKKALAETWKDAGINTVFASTTLLSDSDFKKYTKANGIKTFAILPIFYDAEVLAKDSSRYAITTKGLPAKEEWVEFICPSDREYIKNKAKSIAEFVKANDPDGISIDFIRHFVFWEKVYSERTFESLPNTCMDKKCISGFCLFINTKLPSGLKDEEAIYSWIKEKHFNQWVEYKCSLITGTVKLIVEEARKIKPELLVNLHIVPWRQNDFNGAIKSVAGQDLNELAKYSDYLSPMTYSHMVKRPPEWVHSVVSDMDEYKKNCILPSIQVGNAYLPEELSPNEFGESLKEALKEPSYGVIFWNWDALSKDKEKLELVKKIR